VKPDLSKLSASELDDFIAEAAERRAKMEPAISRNHPQQSEAIIDPSWFTGPIPKTRGHIALQIRHPGLGWLCFAIPPHEIASLMKFWSAILATIAAGEQQGNLTNPASGGGTLH
jgi:hypothetical protein